MDATKERAVSTRQRLLEAAERLFLEKGYGGVSVRDLTEAAGVNVAAINYHFNGKKNLFREVFRRILAPVVEQRLAELEEVIDGKGTPDLRKVIRTYVSGVLGDLLSSNDAERCCNLVSSEMAEAGVAVDVLVKEMVAPIHRVMKDAISRARPGLSDEKISLCIASVVGQVIHFARAREIIRRLTGRNYNRKFIEDIIEHITDFSLKGIG
jgi:AcrR family transcriptional regulator